MFKKLRGVDLSYERQGFIRFCCLTYSDQPQETKDRILNLCIRSGKDNYQALFEFMTTSKSAVNIAAKHFVTDMTLYRMRKKFYHAWFDVDGSIPKKLPELG
ncbi:MAG: hypothetical protein FWE04_01290 [Oscillospiraceae bacterium]|nr:hypothetical protein [Oscillospiraceae bacterium]